MKKSCHHIFPLTLAILFLFCGAVRAENDFTLEQVFSVPYPYHLVSAARADRIAWMSHVRGERNIWTAAAPDFQPVRLTSFSKDEVFEIPEVRVSSDGSIIIYVRGGRPNSQSWVTNPTSDPKGQEQAVWAVRSSGGAPWRIAAGGNPVLSPDGRWILIVKSGSIHRHAVASSAGLETSGSSLLFRAQGRNGSPKWSPDGSRIAFVSDREDHAFIGIFHSDEQKITWISPSVDRDSNPVWSPDGKQVAFLRSPGRQYQSSRDTRDSFSPAVWIADIASGKAREIWNPQGSQPKFFSLRNFTWFGEDLLLFSAENDNWNHIFSLSTKGGPAVDLTPGEGFVEHVHGANNGQDIYFSTNLSDLHGRQIWKVSTADGKMHSLTGSQEIGTYPVGLASNEKVAFFHATAVHPTSIALVPASGGKIEVVAPQPLPGEFPISKLVKPELVIVKAPDGLEIPCQLFLPEGAETGDNRPGVVFTHGGPIRQMLLGWHYMDFYSDAYAINQYFANRGYVVISINYRSGIGYGRSFRNAEKTGRRGASEYQDLVAGAIYLQNRPEVDADRIGLWGLSYGGLMTAMGLARNSDIFKAGVDLAGVHDWSQVGRGDMSGEAGKTAFDSSPVADVDYWKSPVLFIHGDDDRNVPFAQTTDIVQKLRAKGDVHIELMICPDEPHEFLLDRNRMDSYKATFEFLDRFLGRGKSPRSL